MEVMGVSLPDQLTASFSIIRLSPHLPDQIISDDALVQRAQ